MDVHCSTCGEPWDVYHLQHDEIYATNLAEVEIATWLQFPVHQRLTPHYREKFAALGWQFGHSVLNVIRCPCCPKEAQANPKTLAVKAALEELLGDDEDGLASTFEDYGL